MAPDEAHPADRWGAAKASVEPSKKFQTVAGAGSPTIARSCGAFGDVKPSRLRAGTSTRPPIRDTTGLPTSLARRRASSDVPRAASPVGSQRLPPLGLGGGKPRDLFRANFHDVSGAFPVSTRAFVINSSYEGAVRIFETRNIRREKSSRKSGTGKGQFNPRKRPPTSPLSRTQNPTHPGRVRAFVDTPSRTTPHRRYGARRRARGRGRPRGGRQVRAGVNQRSRGAIVRRRGAGRRPQRQLLRRVLLLRRRRRRRRRLRR